jgi:hypothetical protein
MAVADQLAEIQRSLGGIEATVAALKERTEDEHHASLLFRQDITSKVSNALERIGKLEDDVKSLKLVVEKTVKPLAVGAGNRRQRIIGFMAAMSLIGTAGAASFWMITNFWGVIQRMIHGLT